MLIEQMKILNGVVINMVEKSALSMKKCSVNLFYHRKTEEYMKYDCFLMMAMTWILKENYKQ